MKPGKRMQEDRFFKRLFASSREAKLRKGIFLKVSFYGGVLRSPENDLRPIGDVINETQFEIYHEAVKT